MNSILKSKSGWFIFAYIVGLLYFAFYLWIAKEGEAESANIMLLIFAHIFTLGACSFSDKSRLRCKLLVRELALFVPVFACFIFFTPKIMGLVGAYAIFLLLGYCHIKVLKAKDLLGHISKAKTQDEATELSGEQLKYVLWIALSAVPLLTFYWNI